MGVGYLRELRPQGRTTLRRFVAGVLLVLLAIVLPSPALAQVATETANAQAAVLSNGQMAKLADMDFGKIARPVVAGTVTMTTSGTCNGSAGIVHTGNCQPAHFSVMHKKNDRIRIREMNGGTIVLTGPGGATMTVTNMTISVSDMTLTGGSGPPGTFGRYLITSDSGIAEFRIGGRLNIGANQAAGVYTGVLTMNAVLN